MLAFAKAHGTLNDFVCFSDPYGTLDLTDEQLRFLCDRRAGIGADGTCGPSGAAHAGLGGDGDAWFMDYRNADGSIAEMCGNGMRVFLRYLLSEGLIDAAADRRRHPGGRAARRVSGRRPDPRVDGHPVDRGRARDGHRRRTQLRGCGRGRGQPHASVMLGTGELDGIDLAVEPGYAADVFPNRRNVEFIEVAGDHHVRMRVWERGVGETFSCGTGTVAAAVAAAAHAGQSEGSWRVDPPGGTLQVDLTATGAHLTGPAVMVARGKVFL